MPGTYCFAFICYGGFGANTLGMLEEILAEKGIKLSYADEVRMPNSNGSAPSPEKVQKIIKAAMIKVEHASKDISTKVEGPIKKKAKYLSKIANPTLYKKIAAYDQKFIVMKQCNSCGLCVKFCPVNNISIDDKYPIWLHHCERCLRCVQWCPKEAVQYGKKTIKWKRYHNPSIKIQDLIQA